jgi:hypothetical protein
MLPKAELETYQSYADLYRCAHAFFFSSITFCRYALSYGAFLIV